ncbi:MAG: hypothetical protein WBQ50_14030 [Nocardioides sp.]
MAGMPVALIDALIRQGATDQTAVSANAGNEDTGLAAMLAAKLGAHDDLLLSPGRATRGSSKAAAMCSSTPSRATSRSAAPSRCS